MIVCVCLCVTRYYMFALGIPIAISIPSITSMVAAGGSMFPLLLFYGGTVAVVSFYGGLFSVLPAYLADVFGPVHTWRMYAVSLACTHCTNVYVCLCTAEERQCHSWARPHCMECRSSVWPTIAGHIARVVL